MCAEVVLKFKLFQQPNNLFSTWQTDSLSCIRLDQEKWEIEYWMYFKTQAPSAVLEGAEQTLLTQLLWFIDPINIILW